ncbi:helix-turn-helix domain-containing protein [Planctomycetales bacterium ZRK34]|nr:helix-turn-helix domain-containing protein [Planctomycetales bacterium ZRK34]
MSPVTAAYRDEFVQTIRSDYPPKLRFEQAAEIANVDVQTVYDWSSRGHFEGFKTGKGRGARLMRDPFCRWLSARN